VVVVEVEVVVIVDVEGDWVSQGADAMKALREVLP
jgi:hypothetical protein